MNTQKAVELKNINNQYLLVICTKRFATYLSLHESEQDLKYCYLALMDAKKSLELSPFWWRSYYLIGCAYNELKKFSKAIHFFDSISFKAD